MHELGFSKTQEPDKHIYYAEKTPEHKPLGMNPLESDGYFFSIPTGPEIDEVYIRIHKKNEGGDLKISHDYQLNEVQSTDKGFRYGAALPLLRAGDQYSILVRRNDGSIHNSIDPYAKQITFANKDRTQKPEPLGVVVGQFEPPKFPKPEIERWQRVIYETHVFDLTNTLPDVPDEIRGTYKALAHPATIKFLKDMGITTVQLQPVQQFTDEEHLRNRHMENHWGYNTLSFFAPHEDYSSDKMAGGPIQEFKEMVDELHKAGLEIMLDVVYNHTAEPDLLESLDERHYIRNQGHHCNYTGCGNTTNMSNPDTLKMTIDSLRYWVEEMGVDGFRFDLGTALVRDKHGHINFDNSPFLSALKEDPVLSKLLEKGLITAEPWDASGNGHHVSKGRFAPNGILEWNDGLKMAIRDMLNHKNGTLGEFVTALSERGWSLNFITAHDGHPIADLVSYSRKHNETNEEVDAYGNPRDNGANHNNSHNHGVEGPTYDPEILRRREIAMRGMLMILLTLPSGTPMIGPKDIVGDTQNGNNNAYCSRDAKTIKNPDGTITELPSHNNTGIDFSPLADPESSGSKINNFIKGLLRIRSGEKIGSNSDTSWVDIWGERKTEHQARQSSDRTFGMVAVRGALLHGQANEVITYINPTPERVVVQLPNDSVTDHPTYEKIASSYEWGIAPDRGLGVVPNKVALEPGEVITIRTIRDNQPTLPHAA